MHNAALPALVRCYLTLLADTVDTRQVARESLIALGTCIGKFTHTNKFMLTIGALDILAQYSKYKVRSAITLASSPNEESSFGTASRIRAL